jgi:hypothetical protein
MTAEVTFNFDTSAVSGAFGFVTIGGRISNIQLTSGDYTLPAVPAIGCQSGCPTPANAGTFFQLYDGIIIGWQVQIVGGPYVSFESAQGCSAWPQCQDSAIAGPYVASNSVDYVSLGFGCEPYTVSCGPAGANTTVNSKTQIGMWSETVSSTPLPASWFMLLSGFLGLGFLAYRGTKKNAALATA